MSLASLGVLRALAASSLRWSSRSTMSSGWMRLARGVPAFVVRRLEDAPIRTLVALRAGSGGDLLGLDRTGPAPGLHRMSLGLLPEEAMTRLCELGPAGSSPVPSCSGSTGSRKGTCCSPSRSPGPSQGRESGRRLASRSPSPRTTSRSCSGRGCRAAAERHRRASSWWRPPARQSTAAAGGGTTGSGSGRHRERREGGHPAAGRRPAGPLDPSCRSSSPSPNGAVQQDRGL